MWYLKSDESMEPRRMLADSFDWSMGRVFLWGAVGALRQIACEVADGAVAVFDEHGLLAA
jgi:hypothetical protein